MTDNINENEVKTEQPVVQAPKTMEERDVNAISKKQLAMKIISQIALYVFLTAMAVIVIFPFYWMLMSSVKTRAEYDLTVPTFWPTMGFRFTTYKEAFAEINFGRVFLNTILVGVVSTVLSLLITILTAYALARFNFWGKNALFAGMLATMMIPGELFTVTNFITVNDLKWTNSAVGTFAALVIPFLVSVFYIYLLRQNFMQIPNELYLAAKVDGTSDFKYLWKIMVPLSAPTLISITILKMMGAWNTYIWPDLILGISDTPLELMTVALRNANWGEIGDIDYPKQMAAVVIATVPLLIVFLCFRKYIIRGVSRSGTKG